jgi:hypothetical protein
MGKKSGDKGRYHRQRKKKLARRVEMRALRAATAEKKSPAAPSKTATKTDSAEA